MAKDYIITIKDGGGLASQQGRRGLLPTVPGNPNVDRRRLAPPVAPFFLWDGGFGFSPNPDNGPGFENYDITIWFPYSQNVGGVRGRWWRKNGDLIIAAFWSDNNPIIQGGTWTEIDASPVSFLGGSLKIFYTRWEEGDPEYVQFQGTGRINGVVQAFRNVSDSDVMKNTSVTFGSGLSASVQPITVTKDSTISTFMVSEVSARPVKNIQSASSNKLQYLSRSWDDAIDPTKYTSEPFISLAAVLSVAPKSEEIDNLSISKTEGFSHALVAVELPAIKSPKPLINATISPTFFAPYYSVGNEMFDKRVGDVICKIFIGVPPAEINENNGWKVVATTATFGASFIHIATRRIDDVSADLFSVASNLQEFELATSRSSVNYEFLGSNAGFGTSAVLSVDNSTTDDLITAIGISTSSFFPQASEVGLSQFSTENQYNRNDAGLFVTQSVSGYTEGTPFLVSMPLQFPANWSILAFKIKRK